VVASLIGDWRLPATLLARDLGVPPLVRLPVLFNYHPAACTRSNGLILLGVMLVLLAGIVPAPRSLRRTQPRL
jgi:hypothetical protein